MNFKHVLKFSGFTALSRLLGLIRDVLLARYLGAGIVSDVFFIAFKLPNLFRRLLAEGSISAAFIPLFNSIKATDTKEAELFSKQVFTILFMSCLVLTVLLEIFAPLLLRIMAPGLIHKGEEMFYLGVTLMRLTLPYLFFISLATFFSAILSSFGRFAVAGALPIILNIVMIAFLYIGGDKISVAKWASIGMLVGGIIQLLIAGFVCFKIKLQIGFATIRYLQDKSKSFLAKLVPVVLGSGAYQINILVDLFAASLLPAGVISYLFYADRIYQLPLAIIGISISTVMLPMLSNKISRRARRDYGEMSFIVGMGLAIPAAFGLAVFASEIIFTVFGTGAFNSVAVQQTADILFILAFALPINILLKLLLPFFYSKGNTKLPFFATLIALLINILIIFPLIALLGAKGIALASLISSGCNLMITLFFFKKIDKFIFSTRFYKECFRLIIVNVTFLILLVGIKVFLFNTMVLKANELRIVMVSCIIVSVILLLIMYKIAKSVIYLEFCKLFKTGEYN